MARLIWGRRLEVHIAGLTITEPKIAVDIRKDISPTPALGDVTIWNLSSEHAARIHEHGQGIEVAAGYGAHGGLIFRGVAQQVVVSRQNLSRTVRIRVGSLTAARKDQAFSTISLHQDMELRALIGLIVQDFQLQDAAVELGSLDALYGAPVPAAGTNPWDRPVSQPIIIPAGFFFVGPTREALTQVVESVVDARGDPRASWFEDDGVIRIHPVNITALNAASSDASQLTISPETGMIGVPTETDEGWRVATFLDHRATLGSFVTLQSEQAQGNFRVVGVRHSGDNWTGSFRTDLELRSGVSGLRPPELIELSVPPPPRIVSIEIERRDHFGGAQATVTPVVEVELGGESNPPASKLQIEWWRESLGTRRVLSGIPGSQFVLPTWTISRLLTRFDRVHVRARAINEVGRSEWSSERSTGLR